MRLSFGCAGALECAHLSCGWRVSCAAGAHELVCISFCQRVGMAARAGLGTHGALERGCAQLLQFPAFPIAQLPDCPGPISRLPVSLLVSQPLVARYPVPVSRCRSFSVSSCLASWFAVYRLPGFPVRSSRFPGFPVSRFDPRVPPRFWVLFLVWLNIES